MQFCLTESADNFKLILPLTEKWVYAHILEQINIYQSGHGQRVRFLGEVQGNFCEPWWTCLHFFKSFKKEKKKNNVMAEH